MSSFSEEQALVADSNSAFYRAFESLDMERMEAVWLRTDDVKCIRGDEPAGIRLGQPVVGADDHRARLDQRHAGERPAGRTPIVKILW